jgi:hypothetical protein
MEGYKLMKPWMKLYKFRFDSTLYLEPATSVDTVYVVAENYSQAHKRFREYNKKNRLRGIIELSDRVLLSNG